MPPVCARAPVWGVNHHLQLQLHLLSCDHAILESSWGRNDLTEDVLGFSGGSVLGEIWVSKPRYNLPPFLQGRALLSRSVSLHTNFRSTVLSTTWGS
jgi:hypothetical protein